MTGSFAVKVNGIKVELTADDTYTIANTTEDKTITVEGMKKKGSSGNQGGGDTSGGDTTPGDGTPLRMIIRRKPSPSFTGLFSSYAIAYQQADEADGDQKCGLCHICRTFLGICYFIWLAAIAAVIFVAVIVILRRKKEEEKA